MYKRQESFNYASLLEKAGLTLKKLNPGKAWLGQVQFTEGTTKISSNTVIGSPLYNAGLDFDDEIVQINGTLIARSPDIADILKTHKPGDVVNIQYKHRTEVKTVAVTLAENPVCEISTFEEGGLTPTKEMLAFRNSWLGTKIK